MNFHESSPRSKNDFIQLNTRRCDGCWECIEACPKQVLGKIDVIWHRHAIIRNAEACNGCKKCVLVCESGAIDYIYMQKSRIVRCEG
jgi:Fe-S-cluster-containing hydrogenase component 2